MEAATQRILAVTQADWVTTMDEKVFEALRSAVNMARFLGTRKIDALKRGLLERGFDEPTADAAIRAWSEYEQRKGVPHG
jgi:hypothetical protein